MPAVAAPVASRSSGRRGRKNRPMWPSSAGRSAVKSASGPAPRHHPRRVIAPGSPGKGDDAPLPGRDSAGVGATGDGDRVQQDPGLTGEERAELERLRAEVARLRAAAPVGAPERPPARAGGRGRWRTLVAGLLVVVGCVLAPLSVVAVWTRNQVTDTDRYVATVSPLARDPAIQAAIADQITAQVFRYIDIQGLTTQALDALAERGLPPRLADQLAGFTVPIANGVQSFTRDQVGKVVASDAFADAWVQANRVAHDELVAALTGQGGGAVTVANYTVRLNMSPFLQTVKARLVQDRFWVAARIPAVNASFVLFQSQDITRARSAFNLLNTLGIWLPILALVLLAVGVYVARDHRRALVGAGIGVAA